MNGNRIFGLATILVVGAVLVLGWMLGVSPLLSQAALADEERANVELNNQAETARLTQMKAQFDRLDEIEYDLAQLRISVPAEVDFDFIYSLLSGIQAGTDTPVKSIHTGEALPYGAATGAEVDTAATTPTATASSDLYTVPITITFDGVPAAQVLTYASAMQNGPRLFLVTSITGDGAGSSSITAFMFVMRDPDAPRGAAALALAGLLPLDKPSNKQIVVEPAPEPTPTVTPTPGDTGTSTPTPTPTP